MTPDLSVILVAAAGAEAADRTMRSLRAQTARARMEVVVVAPSADRFDAAALGEGGFVAIRVVEAGTILTRGEAAAAGVRAARAPVVALVEDHSYPRPAWAQAFLDAHASGAWAGVGPLVHNANPDEPLSVANFILTYASLSGPQAAGPRPLLAWHNAAYRRDLLLGYGPRLGALLDWEGDLQRDLQARGFQLYLETGAETDHLNVSGLRSTLRMHFLRGRIMGAVRSGREAWPAWRRAAYVAGAPLFPIMQWRHVAAEVRRWGIPAAAWAGLAPRIALALATSAAGEAVGYAAGAGTALRRWQTFELFRTRHLAARERDRWEAPR